MFSSKVAMEIDGVQDVLSDSNDGYDLDLFEKSNYVEKYKCAICRKVLRNAVQVPQDQVAMRACQKCYVDNIRYIILHRLASYICNTQVVRINRSLESLLHYLAMNWGK